MLNTGILLLKPKLDTIFHRSYNFSQNFTTSHLISMKISMNDECFSTFNPYVIRRFLVLVSILQMEIIIFTSQRHCCTISCMQEIFNHLSLKLVF